LFHPAKFKYKMPVDRLSDLMAQRNRKSYMPPSSSADLESGLGSDEHLVKGQNDMTAFYKSIDIIKYGISKIERNIEDIDHWHKKSLAAKEEFEANKAAEQIDIIMENQTKLAASDNMNGNSELRIRQTQHGQFTKKFIQLMNNYQSLQINYSAKSKQQLQRQYLIVRPNATDKELDQVVQLEGGQMMASKIFSTGARTDAKKLLHEMQDRHQDILAVEKSIGEMNQLFVEMAVMVEQQQDVINNIEANVGQAADYTQSAKEELKVAVVHQKSLRKKKWIFLIILIIFLAILGVVLFIYVIKPLVLK
jgi:t-SNARE complex subunit (syntaxin)